MAEEKTLTIEQQQLVNEIMEKSSQNFQRRVDELVEVVQFHLKSSHSFEAFP